MGTIIYKQAAVTTLKEGVEYRLGYTDHLMMAVIDFTNGPQAQPDSPHTHPHE